MTMRRRVVFGLTGAVFLRPALAGDAEMAAAIQRFTDGATPVGGRVHLDIAPLVENGNAVPVTIRVDSAMSAAEHVQQIALFNQLNPQPDVAIFKLSPGLGRAEVSTRIRLATSQQLVALARFSDGSFGMQRVDVIVTLAACVE